MIRSIRTRVDTYGARINPYFHRGKAGEGIGGPHIGNDMIWPMSIMMRAFTSKDDKEIRQCIEMLMNTDDRNRFHT